MNAFCVACRIAVISALLSLCSTANAATQIEHQRDLFRAVFKTVERGDWSAIDALSALDQLALEQYVLWPDLRSTWMRANLQSLPGAEVEAFIRRYGTLRPARELRYRYALNRVRRGDLPAYLRIYEQFYQGQKIAKLDCLALQAEIQAGQYQRVDLRAIDLWMVGRSQVDECDPVFEYLSNRKLLGSTEYQKRYALALDQENYSLAKWLAKKISPRHVEVASQWSQAQANPEDFLRANSRQPKSATLSEQLTYAVKRLTYRDPRVALDLWRRVVKYQDLSVVQRLRTARHIALWTARDKLPGAYELLADLPTAARNDEVLRWRARVSLRNARWKNLLADIASMSLAEQANEQWRYWRSVALKRLGQTATANAALTGLSQERSYYGFLAADELDRSYTLDHTDLHADEAKLALLNARADIVRARELFYVGQDSRGRSEWDRAVRALSDSDKAQAAILAHRWGWHSRAIATAASLGEYDDLSIRYPLPYRNNFSEFSSVAKIPSTWAYGIARSESLFMRDVKSSAGAIGLMQLMPATGRSVAKKIKLPYAGLTTLVDPASNIRLGTTYLGQMAEHFGGNHVLATAAYNAGPHRVDRWLPQDGTIDARIWIENIPFNETRKYVRRVLAAQAIFHWRMTGKIRRVSDELLVVKAASETPQVASRQ